ncbi:MAG: cytochrome c oxidase subunit [Actinomycetota bacterium]|nr:cytochrome c oxidase subunit [Actinomycetota bacterium]
MTVRDHNRHDIGKATLAPNDTAGPSPRAAFSRRPCALLLLCAAMLVGLTGCSSEDLPTFAMPARGVTDQAPRILSLWQGAWIAALAVGAITWTLILWPTIFHRRRRGDTGLPPQTRYNVPIEVLYTIIPIVMVCVFFFFTARDEDRILQTSATPDHQITVTGEQWSWQFTYASDGGDAATVTGTPAKPPTLMLPQGESVKFTLVSDDVIHSFWVPAFLFKLDVIPGQHNTFQVTPKKLGTYAGKCAELCGQDHSRMLFNVKVVSPDQYSSYIASLKAGNAP